MDIAYCPERFNPGDEQRGQKGCVSVGSSPRVIGIHRKRLGEARFNSINQLTSEDVRVGKLEVAEAAKVIENVQRDINIALVNELDSGQGPPSGCFGRLDWSALAQQMETPRIYDGQLGSPQWYRLGVLCCRPSAFPAMDVDVEDVLSAAATKWNFHRYTPGVGVGGHCIPVDPYYMIQRASDVGVPAGLITAARAVNRSMPNHVAQVLVDILWKAGLSADSTKVLFLGWSYKAEVGDPRETPNRRTAGGSAPAIAASTSACTTRTLTPRPSPNRWTSSQIFQVKGHHLAVLVTAHKACVDLDWSILAQHMETPRIYDGRRVLDLEALKEAGWECYAVGRPTNVSR